MTRRAGVTREQVVAVAAELADAYGLEQVTLAQVAKQVGVQLPSLYNHIDGLPGLRRELTFVGLRQLGDAISRAAIGKAGDEAVLAVAQAYRRYVLAHPGVYAATVQAPAPDDQALAEASRAIVEVVLAVLAPYGLAEQAAIHAVRGLRSIVHGFATVEVAGGFGIPLDRDESFLWLLRTYLAGLRAMPL
ncbi:MAG: TetR/AcrR family transcriptional regulator [Caldilineaceae bacterium]